MTKANYNKIMGKSKKVNLEEESQKSQAEIDLENRLREFKNIDDDSIEKQVL